VSLRIRSNAEKGGAAIAVLVGNPRPETSCLRGELWPATITMVTVLVSDCRSIRMTTPVVLTPNLQKIIFHHVGKDWEHCRYEDMIIGRKSTDLCIANELGLVIPFLRAGEVAWYAAQALRKLFPERHDEWAKRLSKPDQMELLVNAVVTTIGHVLTTVPPPRTFPMGWSGNKKIVGDGFTEWVLYRCRDPVPKTPGVYLLAQYGNHAPQNVDPLDAAVIDIGMTETQGLAERLSQFSVVALTGRGQKSTGWTYRTEYEQITSYEKLWNFDGLFVSWSEMPGCGKKEVRDRESEYKRRYFERHGRHPLLNRRF
jgi:hypothetical protein